MFSLSQQPAAERREERQREKDSPKQHRLRKTGSTTVVTKRKEARRSSAGVIGARHNLATTRAYSTRTTSRSTLPSPNRARGSVAEAGGRGRRPAFAPRAPRPRSPTPPACPRFRR